MLDKNSIVRRTGRVSFTRLHDEMLAMDEAAGYCYALNGSGTRIWELLDKPVKVEAICASLQEEFDVDEEHCLRDVLVLLTELQKSGFIEESI